MPVDFVSVKLTAAVASNTGQAFIGTWDQYVSATAGTIRNVTFIAQSVSSNVRVNTADLYKQASGVSGASNSATSVLTGPVAIASNMNAANGVISQAGQRIAAGDVLQLKTDTAAIGALGFVNLSATILIAPD